MVREPIAHDTAPDIERRQVEGWRQMSPSEKAELIVGLTGAVFDLALAGLRARYPAASARELFLRQAILIHGRELAARAYPEIRTLGLE